MNDSFHSALSLSQYQIRSVLGRYKDADSSSFLLDSSEEGGEWEE